MAVIQPDPRHRGQIGPSEYPRHHHGVRPGGRPIHIDGARLVFHGLCTLFAAAAAALVYLADIRGISVVVYTLILVVYGVSWTRRRSEYAVDAAEPADAAEE